MRYRLGGCAAALSLALTLGGCGSDSGSDTAAPQPPTAADLADAALVSARDTLPLVPAATLTTERRVLLVHPDGADAVGLDAAATALAARPDLAVEVIAPGAAGATTTASGFPVDAAPGTAAEGVARALAAPGAEVDLVLVGLTDGHGIGVDPPSARTAVRAGVPALVVGVEEADGLDHAAAAMQLLDVLDLELDALVASPPAIHRLSVPSCRSGMLRGRMVVDATTTPPGSLSSDCTSTIDPAGTEADAFANGWATLSRLP